MQSPERKNSPESPYHNVTGVILAGGESKRMGPENKALLKIGGAPIISRVARVLSAALETCVIITNTPSVYKFLNLPLYPDIQAGFGALGGLCTGLKVARTPRIFMVACDMPFLRVEAIDLMLDMINNADVIVPKVEGHFEPLHAIYSRSCLPPIEELMERGDLKILNIFPKVIVKEVEEERLRSIEPELRFLMNVNTISQLERARLIEGAGEISPGD